MPWLTLLATLGTLGAGLVSTPQQAEDRSRLYARVTLTDGTVYEGVVRWGDIEAGWSDQLNASREVSDRNLRQRARAMGREWEPTPRRSIRIFGERINLGDKISGNNSEVTIRLGHIRTIRPMNDGELALLVLKSGEELELIAGSSDLGDRMRGFEIEDATRGETSLRWSQIAGIEFTEPVGTPASGRRLFGTLVTRDGAAYTGAITWDRDEVLDSEELNGEDESGQDHDLAFADIASIARESGSRARVVLRDGRQLTLSGTNDVNRDNRGILVSDPGFGQIEIGWDDFAKLTFGNAADAPQYGDFDGGHPLIGTVYSEDGKALRGRIRWDNDEEYTWETLDGEYGDFEIDIEFEMIASIEKTSFPGALVTVRDGRTFAVNGSNDVDDDNKGIFVVTAGGELVMLTWEQFRRVEFEHLH